MNKVYVVLFFTIVKRTIITAIGISFCSWIIQSSKFTHLINDADISFYDFINFISYALIPISCAILPVALCISVIFTFHKFKESNQLIATQSLSMRPYNLAFPVILCGGILFFTLLSANMCFSPFAEEKMKNLEFQVMNKIPKPERSGSIFSNAKFSIYAQKYFGDLKFGNIFIVDNRISDLSVVYFAKEGNISDNALILSFGERIECNLVNGKNSRIIFEKHVYDLTDIIAKKIGVKKLKEMNLLDLLYGIRKNSSECICYKAELFDRIAQPMLAFIMPLIAFCCVVFSAYRRKHSYVTALASSLIILIIQGIFVVFSKFFVSNPQYAYMEILVMLFCCMLIIVYTFKNKKL